MRRPAIGRDGEGFCTLKGDLAVRPVYHQQPERIEAHRCLAFLASRFGSTCGCWPAGLCPSPTKRSMVGCGATRPRFK